MTPSERPASVASPIADLSYRGYDGPLRAHPARWWIVALAGIRGLVRNQWFWAMTVGAFLPYVFHGLIFYMSQMVSPLGGGHNPMMPTDAGGHKYGMVFFQASAGFEMLWLFGIALLIGAGGIAADNRANALQVYLSKPITKGDYLLGKWMSVFLAVTAVALAPALVLYAFMGAAYAGKGFFTNEPMLIVHVLLVALLPGVMHASLLTGFSAWSSSSRVAGALYAAVYFVGEILVGILWLVLYGRDPSKGVLLQHCSISGIVSGLAQAIHGITIQFNAFRPRFGSMSDMKISPPNPWILLAAAAVLCVVSVAAARWKIRAVEVVRG